MVHENEDMSRVSAEDGPISLRVDSLGNVEIGRGRGGGGHSGWG